MYKMPIARKTQMKSQHKGGPCNTIKSNGSGARSQNKIDVRSAKSTTPRRPDQQKRDVRSGQSALPRQSDQHKRDVRSSQATRPKPQDQHRRDVRSSHDTRPKPQDQHRRDIRSSQATRQIPQDQHRRDVRSSQATRPKPQDQHRRDVRSSQDTRPKPQDQNRRDIRSSQATRPIPQDQHRRDVRSSQTTRPKAQDQHKRDVRSSQAIRPKTQDQYRRDFQSSQATRPKAQDQHKQDVRSSQAARPKAQYQHKGSVQSCQAYQPRQQDQSSAKTLPKPTPSSRQDVPKQPKHNTRFLTSLQSSGDSLKRLHDEKVRQDPDKMKRCNEIVRQLVNFMQHNLKYKVSEVVKGGSLGKGTSIKEKVDIDLVVFMNQFKSVADLQEHREEVIKDLKKHILKDFTFAKQVHYSYDTKHSNRFGIRTDDGKDLIQVDLLPACDIGGGSKSTFKEMAGLDEEARSYYSVSFVKDQKRFTKEKPEPVKDAIRLVKDWKTREKLNIPSYSAEIITSKEWERMGRPDNPDLNQLFKRTMTQLSDMGNINVAWSNSRATGDTGPIVMDPANPFNNTASMIERSEQEDIERKAREVVSRLN